MVVGLWFTLSKVTSKQCIHCSYVQGMSSKSMFPAYKFKRSSPRALRVSEKEL